MFGIAPKLNYGFELTQFSWPGAWMSILLKVFLYYLIVKEIVLYQNGAKLSITSEETYSLE
jgi:hypothetical protein